MPYVIRRKGNRYQVVNSETGDVKAEATSKAKAEKKLELLRGIERNWTASGPDTYTRRINGKTVKLHVTGGSKASGTQRGGKESAGSTDSEVEGTGRASR